jgi:hypothetical protein
MFPSFSIDMKKKQSAYLNLEVEKTDHFVRRIKWSSKVVTRGVFLFI